MGLLTALSGTVVPGGDLGMLVSVGLLGASLLDRFRDGGGGTGGADGDDDDDPLLDDDGAFGGDGGDDLDGLGGMDDWNDDDPFGGEEDDTAELENRLEDLENEVASLSSTVGTVRSENEEISGQVDDMGEDVRSLLDIYEMVTRGINPFVDDVQTGGMGGDLGGEASFGLFDGDDDEGEEEEGLDDDLASADAESFFDEDLADDGFDDDFDAESGDEFGDFDDDDTTDTETMATENGGGKSFSELKDEYESGDADWADADSDGGSADDPVGADGTAEDDVFDGGDPAPLPDSGPAPAETAPVDAGGFEFVEEDDLSAEPGKPYLTELPGDYVGDLLVMEWLEYLVEESNATDAVRAVNYYERVEWVDGDVAERLKAFLSGFGGIDRNHVDDPGTAHLTLDHHTQSLKYVMQLTDATAESVVIDRWPQLSGGFRGSQR